MSPDLEHVIALQRLDSAEQEAARRLADEPEREKSFVERLDSARERLKSAKQRLAENQEARRAIEKEVAVHQGRLSKFRDQAMAVKTNQEYHAVQKEITYAQSEIKALEEKVLERMLEADDLTATAKRAEAELATEQKTVDAERRAMTTEHAELTALRVRLAAERSEIVSAMDKHVLAIFDVVARRRHGVAVAEARDGICTICHVRLRPQVFNNVRRNTEIIQCDTCQRILYFVPPPAPAAESVTQQPSQ
jgi:predicted  nucleic acid-binding Zn-ribbon protein